MNLTKCSNGHFYDSDTYPACPHCGGNSGGSENVTVAFNGSGDSVSATVDLDSITPKVTNSPNDMIPDATVMSTVLDDSKTISIYPGNKSEEQPTSMVVGWLVCTKGKMYGRDFRLKLGRNFIGRGTDMDVCLAGEMTVSRDRHATIIYEPRKNIFIAQPGEARELFYVNGEVVLSPLQLKKNDVLQIGDVYLMLIPCCDDIFTWDKEA